MVKALVLKAPGTNCDEETAWALKLAGASPDLVSIQRLFSDPKRLLGYAMAVLPGGFSYGDDVASGKILANQIRFRLRRVFEEFVSRRNLVIGICNGFQVLVRAGLLPGWEAWSLSPVTLTWNPTGKFVCRWVSLQRRASRARWLGRLPRVWELPIAHAEGRFLVQGPGVLRTLKKRGQVFLTYSPENPNGSDGAVAGICNLQGNVLGLMPHPERFVTPYQHPQWTRKGAGGIAPVGLEFWKAAVRRAVAS